MADIGETMFTNIETPAHEDTTSGIGTAQAYLFDGWSFTPMIQERQEREDQGRTTDAARAAA